MIERESENTHDIQPKGGEVHKFLSRLQPTGLSIEGGLNRHEQYVAPDGSKFLHRVPKERQVVVDKMLFAYDSVGFMQRGGAVRYLDASEQSARMHELHAYGLKTILPVVEEADEMVIPFIDGETLLEQVHRGTDTAIPGVFTHLVQAHQLGVVFGDRRTPNTIVKPDNDFVEIDFDITLSGPVAKEFEMAQFLYHLLLLSPSRQNMVDTVGTLMQDHSGAVAYDRDVIGLFMRNFARHYDGDVFEGRTHNIAPHIEDVVRLIT